MKTFHRVCLRDYTLEAQNGDRLELKRAKEYLTSAEQNGTVVVFTNFWVRVPVDLFAGAEAFTP